MRMLWKIVVVLELSSCCCSVSVVFFFFKQKTAYEMRISDWSSDVCSSDLEGAALLDRAGRGDEGPRLRLVVQAVEQVGELRRHTGTAESGKLQCPGEIGDRQDARHDRHPDARGGGAVAEPEIGIVVEEELGDGPGGARVDLALQVVQEIGRADV